MKKVVVFSFGLLLLAMVGTACAVPGTINYQGVMTDSVGVPVVGDQSISFRLFNVASGGSALWTETQTVTVSGGTYSVQLGAVSPLSGLTFSAPYWLEVEIGGETLAPRQALTSVPYAMKAASVEQIDESALPANGLAAVSNNLLSNQFVEIVAGTASLAIPDNNPNGVEDSLFFPPVGVSENLWVTLHLTNSDTSTVSVTLTDPNGIEYLLWDGTYGGTELNFSYPPSEPVSGDLTSWVGYNPQGTWTLKVVDGDFLNNGVDGEIVSWSVSSQYVSNQTVAVASDLDVAGTVSGDGSGLTALEWGSLTNVPAGFSDNVDDMVSSVDGLAGGQISDNVGIGTSVISQYQLNVSGSGTEVRAGYFNTNYAGSSNSFGLYARNDVSGAGDHYGLFGVGYNSSNFNYGVYGAGGNGDYARGVYGTASGATIFNRAVEGYVNSSSARDNYGIYGRAYNGTSTNSGVYGYANGLTGTTNYGIYGAASGGTSYAGYFNGDSAIMGNTTIGTDTKDSSSQLKVVGGSADTHAGYFENNDTVGTAYGLVGSAEGTTNHDLTYYHYGVRGHATGARYNYALYGNTSDSAANYGYGVYGDANSGNVSYGVFGSAIGGSPTSYGVYGRAYNGTYNYAIYGRAANSTSNYAGYFYGNVAYTGSLTDVSDRRLKDNIHPLENSLSKIDAINGVYFNMQDSPDVTEVGVIAQDVQAVLPEAVNVIDEEGHLGVSYPSLIPVLIEAVKELKAQNEMLQEQNVAFKELLCGDHPSAEICQ